MNEEIALLRAFFDRFASTPPGVVIAVSGGVDSLALLLLLTEWSDRDFPVVVAHVDHGLRPESARDASVVKAASAAVGVEAVVLEADIDETRIREVGVEAAAREARYGALYAIADDLGGYLIATGHHRDDQAETVMMRLLQKASPLTLRGIAPVSPDGRVVRPLLGLPRERLSSLVEGDPRLAPVVDSMNLDRRFLRARVRHDLLPCLPPGTDVQLAGLAASFLRLEREVEALMPDLMAAWNITASRAEVATDQLPTDPLLRRELLSRVVRSLGSTARRVPIRRLDSLLASADLPRTSIGSGLYVSASEGRLTIESPEVEAAREMEFHEPLRPGQTVWIPGGYRASVSELSGPPDDLVGDLGMEQVVGLDPSADPVFVVRPRRPGDRFQPLGCSYSTKLAEFLIDRKVPRSAREALPLFETGEEICWIPGVEVSESFRVTGGKALYRLSLEIERGEVFS